MKTQKMSLANIENKLSRAEMKNIMAGSGSTTCEYLHPSCSTDQDCINVNKGVACCTYGDTKCCYDLCT